MNDEAREAWSSWQGSKDSILGGGELPVGVLMGGEGETGSEGQ